MRNDDIDCAGPSEEVIDVPANLFFPAQVPPNASLEAAHGRADVGIIAGPEVQHTELANAQREVVGDVQEQGVGSARHRLRIGGGATFAFRRGPELGLTALPGAPHFTFAL